MDKVRKLGGEEFDVILEALSLPKDREGDSVSDNDSDSAFGSDRSREDFDF